jgi:MSHA biogenesis protein MshK
LSSILKALKKIEEEAPPPETFPSLPRPIYSKQAQDSKIRKRRRVRSVLFFLILLIAAGAAAGFFINRHRRMLATNTIPPAAVPESGGTAAPPRTNQIYKSKITAAPEKFSQPRSTATHRPPTPKKLPGTGGSGPGTSQAGRPSDSSGSPADGALQAKTPAPKPALKKPLKAKTPTSPRRKPALTGVAPAGNPAAPKENAPTQPAATTAAKTPPPAAKAAYERLEDSKLKLQALAWSADVARRMAVINGRIVREGESVDGYQIMQIREEDVVVSEGGRSWRLEFGVQR